jgi:CRISPR-associated protein Cas2
MKDKNRLVLYDIRDPKRLLKVAKIMENFGFRVQKSVFEVICNDNTLEKLRKEIRNTIEEEDFVAYFEICAKDWQKKEKYGKQNLVEEEEKSYYII